MKDKKILIGEYIDSYLPAIDGVIVTVQNYARWLNEKHCACYVATAEGPRGYVDSDPFEVIRYRSVPIPKHPPYRFGIPILDVSYVAKNHQLAPDLVHAHSPFTAGYEAQRVAHHRKIPLVASFHTKYYDDIFEATNSELLSETAVKMIVEFYHTADYVWTVNEKTAETLRSYGYVRDLEIMPNGTDYTLPEDTQHAIDAVNDRFGFNNDEKIMLYVGQIEYKKNLMMLMDAIALYKQKNRNFKLLLVGQGTAREDLEQRCQELNISDVVIFAGVEPSREKLFEIYIRADLFTFPSVFDTFGLVVVEAASAACPAVLIKGSSAASNTIHNENAFLCKNDTQSLCNAIEFALSNDENLKRVGINAEKTLATPWNKIVDKVYDRYLEIIEEFKHVKKEVF